MNTKPKTITIVVPAYNEEENIKKMYDELQSIFKTLQSEYFFETIFINDGSQDKTETLLNELSEKDTAIKIINFSRNFGHQIAISAGIDMAEGDAIVIMDCDLQDPPSVLKDMIRRWEEGFDVVYAVRRSRKDTFFKKKTASLFYDLIHSIADLNIPKDTGDFRLLDKKVVLELRKFREKSRFMRGLTCYVGFKQTGVEFDRQERYAGKTHYSLNKMLKLSIDAITAFSYFPLKVAAWLGWGAASLSFAGILYALIRKMLYPQAVVSGWTAIIIAVFFLGGIQLIVMGMIGEYIGRIYTETKNRPLYIIKSTSNLGHPPTINK